MKLVLDIFFFFVIIYFCYQFVQVVFHVKQGVTFPYTKEELNGLRKHPTKPLNPPTMAGQKVGIYIYGGLLIFCILIYLLGIYYQISELTFYLMLILIFTYADFGINIFAIHQKGIVSGVRFVPWKMIRSFQFVPIDTNHRFYGYSKEANEGYELIIKTKLINLRCIVTDERLKEELEILLKENLKVS